MSKFGYLGCLIVGTLATLQAINTYSLAAETPEIQQHPTATKKSNTQIIPKTNKTAKQKSANKPEDDLLGIWSTHYQQTFITVIINADRTAQFLLIDQGHSIGTVTWRPAPNGLIVDGLPMLRFWKSKNKEYARVLMEELPPEMTNDSMQRFPLSFYMRKSGGLKNLQKQLLNRPVKEDWLLENPPASFEKDAGRPRRFPR